MRTAFSRYYCTCAVIQGDYFKHNVIIVHPYNRRQSVCPSLVTVVAVQFDSFGLKMFEYSEMSFKIFAQLYDALNKSL